MSEQKKEMFLADDGRKYTKEQYLNKLRRGVLLRENVWLVCCILSFIATFTYLFFIYKFGLLAGSPWKYINIILLLLLTSFNIYLLPIVLRKNTRYTEYSAKFKQMYVKPLLEDAFGSGSYTKEEKVSIKEITEFSMLKKARSARANDCVKGNYDGVPFIRYDLTMKYENKSGKTDCVLIVAQIDTNLKEELQLVHEDFGIGKADYEQPDDYCQVLSPDKDFDKKFFIYAKNQREGEKFARKLPYRKLISFSKKLPVAAFFDRGKVYLVVGRGKDVMEAPIYRAVKEGRCIKEAEAEVDLIKNWISILKECV